MIKSFSHKGLKLFYETGSMKGIQPKHAAKLRIILSALDAADVIRDLNIPAFKLHELGGKRSGTWSIWVSGNWRVTFRFENGEAEIINYEDYH